MALPIGEKPRISTDMQIPESSRMKTYERKKLVNEEIEEVLDLCRLCLKKPEKEVPIFKNSQDMCAALAMRIMICVGLEITHEDYLPNKICMNCYQELDKYYKFRRKCEVSYQKLKAHVSAMKEKVKYLNKHKSTLNYVPMSIINKDDVAHFLLQNNSQESASKEKVNQLNNHKTTINYIPIRKINKEHFLVENNSQESARNEKAKQLSNDKSTLHYIPISKINKEDEEHYLVENNSQESAIKAKVRQFHNDKSILNNSPISKIDKDAEYLVEHKDSKQSLKIVEQESEAKESVTEEEVQIPIKTSDNPDISTFLTTVLSELGILSQSADRLTLVQGVSDLQLETGDGQTLVLELVEEHFDNRVSNPLEIDIINTLDEGQLQLKGATKRNRKGAKKKAGSWCARCGRVFASVAGARRHAAAHGGARPHSCRTCHRAFAQRAARDRHMLVHLEQRPFKCPSCPKSFTQRGGLAAHARTHAPPHRRPLPIHACALCHKVFLHASGLSRHMTSHGGRAFECDACARRFSDRSSLARHLRNTHPHT